ncbi:MAG TPA: MFS transporter [Acidimicrobiales bacterium]
MEVTNSLEVAARTPRRALILVAASLGAFATFLDNNVVNVAIPSIQHYLHLSQTGIEWIVSAYILFFAGLLLAGGRLADVLGRRRLFVLGAAVFTASSMLAGFSTSASMLIASRALQGVGAAMLTPTTLSIITYAYPEKKEQARAVGIWGAVGALALAVGPVLGGTLTQHLSWKWIFFINLPIGLAAIALCLFALPRQQALVRRSLDWSGIAASSLALFSLTFALIQGTRDGWTSTIILSSFATATLASAAFLFRERHALDPMVDLTIFKDRIFVVGSAVLAAWAFGLFGIYFFTAIYLQDVLRFSPTKAGAAFVPMAILMAVGATFAGAISHRVRTNRMVAFALFAMGLGIAATSFTGAHSSFLDLMPAFALIGCGGGFTVPLSALVINRMPADKASTATAIFSATREVAGLLGITLIGVVLSTRENVRLRAGDPSMTAFLSGYRWALFFAAGVVLLGGVVAFFGLPRVSDLQVSLDEDVLVLQ